MKAACSNSSSVETTKSCRRLAVILHRIWVDGTEFRWTRELAAPAT